MQAMKRMQFGRWLIIAFVFLPLSTVAQQAAPTVDWKPLVWLAGDWTATGGGGPGQGAGGFSFHQDLQGQVLVRKNYSEYPPANGKPAYRHDDLTIVYHANDGFRADYFDNEGHAIRYSVATSADGNTVTFLSDEAVPGPRFRLTYRKLNETTLAGTFEIAPPDKPNDFSKYLEWTAQKQSAK